MQKKERITIHINKEKYTIFKEECMLYNLKPTSVLEELMELFVHLKGDTNE